MLLCMRTTLDIHDDLLIRAKKRAVEAHQTLTAFVEDALRSALGPSKKKKAKPFKVITYGGGKVDPRFNPDKPLASLYEIEGYWKENGSFRY